jgi:hypothetical protein
VSTLTVDEFRRLVAEARINNPKCCYCGKDLTGALNKDVMYMKNQKRLACHPCPEATEIKFS